MDACVVGAVAHGAAGIGKRADHAAHIPAGRSDLAAVMQIMQAACAVSHDASHIATAHIHRAGHREASHAAGSAHIAKERLIIPAAGDMQTADAMTLAIEAANEGSSLGADGRPFQAVQAHIAGKACLSAGFCRQALQLTIHQIGKPLQLAAGGKLIPTIHEGGRACIAGRHVFTRHGCPQALGIGRCIGIGKAEVSVDYFLIERRHSLAFKCGCILAAGCHGADQLDPTLAGSKAILAEDHDADLRGGTAEIIAANLIAAGEICLHAVDAGDNTGGKIIDAMAVELFQRGEDAIPRAIGNLHGGDHQLAGRMRHDAEAAAGGSARRGGGARLGLAAWFRGGCLPCGRLVHAKRLHIRRRDKSTDRLPGCVDIIDASPAIRAFDERINLACTRQGNDGGHFGVCIEAGIIPQDAYKAFLRGCGAYGLGSLGGLGGFDACRGQGGFRGQGLRRGSGSGGIRRCRLGRGAGHGGGGDIIDSLDRFDHFNCGAEAGQRLCLAGKAGCRKQRASQHDTNNADAHLPNTPHSNDPLYESEQRWRDTKHIRKIEKPLSRKKTAFCTRKITLINQAAAGACMVIKLCTSPQTAITLSGMSHFPKAGLLTRLRPTCASSRLEQPMTEMRFRPPYSSRRSVTDSHRVPFSSQQHAPKRTPVTP